MQDINNRLHNNLVMKATHKKVLSAATSNQSNRKVHPARNVENFNALQSKSNLLHSSPQQTNGQSIVSAETSTLDEAIIVRRTKEKKHILDAYEERIDKDFDHSIVSKKKGKIKQDPNLIFFV